jgi:acyl-CoA thioesterase FadM
MVEQTETYRVAWVDTDASGRIHYTAAFRWAEATEAALFRRLGVLDEYGRYPRRRVEAGFTRMLAFEDQVQVRLRVERVGTTSVTLSWLIESGQEVAVEGSHTLVFVGEDGRSRPLRDDVRAALVGAVS